MATKQPQVFESPFELYESVRQIGEGGAGRVFEARTAVGATYAVKCLSPENVSGERRKRFKNEINYCQTQKHPNVIRVVDAGTISIKGASCPFYVMSLYDGTLRSRISSLTTDSVLPVFAKILDGVEAAHFSRVWHRDLKPENILLNNSGELVVADFGIAHFEEESILTAVETKVASRMANFQYSAPEQRVRGARVDHTADIFALGLMLNEMFTKDVPHGSGFKKIGDVSAAHSYVDEIVDRMLQQNPAARFQSIEDVKAQLIGKQNAFVALQRYDKACKETVPDSSVPAFAPIKIVALDFDNDRLTLELSGIVPEGWAEAFHNPRGGYSSIQGYGPGQFVIRGNLIHLGMRGENERTIQRVVDHAKQYVESANSDYVVRLEAQAREAERRKRGELEAKVAAEERRKNLLANIRL
jgi:serine/threonine protein kinase